MTRPFITQAHQNYGTDNPHCRELKVLCVAVCFVWTTISPKKTVCLLVCTVTFHNLSPLLHSGFTAALPQFNTSY